jgi:transcriptional regulator with XRE-family HTH domain
MTQKMLANHCGIFRTYLSRIEGGIANPTITVLASLATALDVKVTALFDD